MEDEIELLNQTEADLLVLMQQYKSGQYSYLAKCIRAVRIVRARLEKEINEASAALGAAQKNMVK